MANKWIVGTLEEIREMSPAAHGGIWKWLLKIAFWVAMVPAFLIATAIGSAVLGLITYVAFSPFIAIFMLIDGPRTGWYFWVTCAIAAVHLSVSFWWGWNQSER